MSNPSQRSQQEMSSTLALKVLEGWLKRWWWTIAIPLFAIVLVGLAIDIRIIMATVMLLMVLFPAALLGSYAYILSRKERKYADGKRK